MAGFYGRCMFNFSKNCQLLSQVAAPFCVPTSMYENSGYYTSSTFGVVSGQPVFLFYLC